MPRIQILIAGGGLGGLALAIMLERLPEHKKVDYLILERSLEWNPMGSAISLHASVIPLLKQLGIWAEIEKASKPMSQFSIKREDGSDLGTVDFAYGQHDYSYYGMVLSRPDLHEILLSHVPSEKILTGKRIVSTTQDDFGVSCHCGDMSIYHGDILIGADGAYSAVRQSLYKDLRSHGNLPRQDFSPIKLDQLVVVGITEPLSPVEYPLLKEDVCQFRIVLGGQDRPYTMWMVPLSDNRLAWSIGGRTDALEGSSVWSESQEEAVSSFGHKSHQYSRFPDWGETESDSIEEICEQMRGTRNPFGFGTYGDLIDKTPKHLISRVMFEEKEFRTWYGGRTVLIGDACHKSVPFGGQGVVNAIFDGACLVNLIHDLPPFPSMENLGDVFQTYYERRYPAARIAIEGSSQFSRLFTDQAQVEEDGHVVMFNSVPRWLQRWTLDKTKRADPKLDFVLARMSRSPSLKSFSSLLEKTSQFETDDAVLADRLAMQDPPRGRSLRRSQSQSQNVGLGIDIVKEVAAKSEVDMEEEVEAKAEAEAEAEAEVEVESEAEVGAETEAEAGAETEAKAGAETEAKAEAEAEIEAEAKAETEAETSISTETVTELKAGIETTDAEVEIGTEAEIETHTESTVTSDTEPEKEVSLQETDSGFIVEEVQRGRTMEIAHSATAVVG